MIPNKNMARNGMRNLPVRGTKPGAFHDCGPGGLSPEGFGRWYRDEILRCWENLDLKSVSRLAGWIEKAEKGGRFVYLMGNGGSAATASHMATDLAKTAHVPGRPRVRAVSLNDNMPYVTAVANDLSFGQVFEHQLEGLLDPGDVCVFITGSGNSPNLVAAAKAARRRGARTSAFLGFDGGRLKGLVDLPILIPSVQYGVIEDLHMGIGHVLAFYLKQRR